MERERHDGSENAADPFGTARLRRAVLDAWAASPARFREDANAEEELARGGYRDRIVVELAQNAADAAARADVPGRLRLELRDGALTAANTGEALSAAGVESLSTLRASAKRDSPAPSAGRFGVGFAATLTVTDAPAVHSRGGAGVRWSLLDALELAHGAAGGVPGSRSATDADPDPDAAREAPAAETGGESGQESLADELHRRGHGRHAVPLLRLPLPAEPARPPEGYDTLVTLPLRDAAAEELAARLLAAVGAPLLLALPGLAEVTVVTPEGTRVLTRRTAPEDEAAPDEEPAPAPASGAVLITEDGRTTRWRTTSDAGRAAPELLADRPLEERERPAWSVSWAVPVQDDGAPAQPDAEAVVHAPTPTGEPLGFPALLIAGFPLDASRREVAAGPLTDFLLDRAADAYARMLAEWQPVGPATLDLVPGPLGSGALDSGLRERVLQRLPSVPFLPRAVPAAGTAEGDSPVPSTADRAPGVPGYGPVDQPVGYASHGPADNGTDDGGTRPGPGDAAPGAVSGAATVGHRDAAPAAGSTPEAMPATAAELIEGAGLDTVTVLAGLFGNLLPAGLERHPAPRLLGVVRTPLGEAIDRVAGAERPPSWWHRLYETLAGVDPDRLTGLPVPLADGRTVIGPRQALLPAPGSDPAPLIRLGLRVVHPDAVHPLLETVGAVPATPRAVLETPEVRAALAAALDEETAPGEDRPGPEELADTILGLARDAELAAGELPWLAALPLPDEDGELLPAYELVIPGSPFQQVIREGELAACDPQVVERWGEAPLVAVGVQADFVLTRAEEVVLDPDELEPGEADPPEPDDVGLLDAVQVWCEDTLDALPPAGLPPVAVEVLGVRDLELVDDDRWPQALALLSRSPLRDALVRPLRVRMPDGSIATARPYTAWWLRGAPVLDGRPPAGLRAAGGDRLLDGLYEAVELGTRPEGADTRDGTDSTDGPAGSGGPYGPAGAGYPTDGPAGIDPQVLRALGVRTSAAALLDEPGGPAELLGRLAEPEHSDVTADQLHGLYTLLAGLDPEEVALPDELRAVVPDQAAASATIQVVSASDVLVADAPDLLPLATGRPLLPVDPRQATALATVLDVPLLSDALPAPPADDGTEHPVPEAARTLLGASAPAVYREHDRLVVDGTEVEWRLSGGVAHAATVEGLAAALAWAAGQWPRRFELAALLEDPERVPELATARWFD